ncbi:hypothetical protein GBAR_LOCUS19723 [Geodia barretti]|uniref:Uncharacterized protein n=1 Tax=Geodia barretti TaxID=519541 RepID=A0AA35X216_GEOBA|nr:hypothetical protein GBAR_LOCUS19723 [Geodia barretti]
MPQKKPPKLRANRIRRFSSKTSVPRRFRLSKSSRYYRARVEGSERESRIRPQSPFKKALQRGSRENERTTRSPRCHSRNYIDGTYRLMSQTARS